MADITSNNSAYLKMTMSLRYLATQIEQLGTYGYPRDRALRILGIEEQDLSDPRGRISLENVEAMYMDASEVLNDPHVGLRVGYNFRIPTYGQTGSVFSYCDNLEHVFHMNGRYQRVAVDAGISRYLYENERHFFVFDPYEEAMHLRHVLAMIFGAYATAFRWLSWGAGTGMKACEVMRPAPDDTSLYEEVLRCPITFGAPRNHVEIYAEAIHTPLLTRDPEKLAHAVALLDGLLKDGQTELSMRRAVQASMRAALQDGKVSQAIIADRIGKPERALRKLLSDMGTNYRELLDKERRKLFLELHDQGLSFAQISQALGYNDQPAFNRAFKRWYGTSPGAYKGGA